MAGRFGKLTDLNCEGVPPRFMYMKSVRTENRSYRASAAPIKPMFRWETKSPKPTEGLALTVPPSAGGWLRLRSVLMFANQRYGARLKVHPEGPGAGWPKPIGCCAR